MYKLASFSFLYSSLLSTTLSNFPLRQARELQGRVERAREAEAVLTRQLDDARRHVDTLTSEGQAARARSQTLEAELADVSDSLARAKAEAAEAAARLEQVEGELEALKEVRGGIGS